MRLPNLRRSKETEYHSLQTQPQPQNGALDKWESILHSSGEADAVSPMPSPKPMRKNSSGSKTIPCSPRIIEDHAHPNMKRERTQAQLVALDNYTISGLFA